MVPLPRGGVDLRIAHPVPLAVHDVVAELHVLQILVRQRRGARDPRGRELREQQQPRAVTSSALRRDHLVDVAGVALAAAGDDLRAQGVELSAQASTCSSVRWSAVSGHGVSESPRARSLQFDLDAPAAPDTHVRTGSPGCRCARRCAGWSRHRNAGARRRCGRCPCGIRWADRASGLAGTHERLAGAASATIRLSVNRTRPPVPAAAVGTGATNRSTCSASRSPWRSHQSARSSSRFLTAHAAQAWRPAQSGTRSARASGVIRPSRAVCLLDQAHPGRAAQHAARRRRRRRLRSGRSAPRRRRQAPPAG